MKNIKTIALKSYTILSLSLFISFLECICYNYWIPSTWRTFWFALVFLTFITLIIIKKFLNQSILKNLSIEAITVLSTLFLFINISCSWIQGFINQHLNSITFIILINCFISVIIFRNCFANNTIENPNKDCPKKLFNIFYLNTSKAHEIAMLIDNKIMKSIEQEQTVEEHLQQSHTLAFGNKDTTSVNSGITYENNYKNRVFESFDVKSTKSIMLRKIYESIQAKNASSLQVGSIRIFENVELQQVNVDDTVMVLNVLQDSKIHNQGNDNVEININKMMDKMLDDFTIDYTFTYNSNQDESSQKFIIQLPYKTNDNFENGYQHNDLQLGKLSIIGIYRGNIDFSKRQSISSKFLDLFSKSYNHSNANNNQPIKQGMKLSCNVSEKSDEIEFDFHHKKLNEKMHLIDVIAIIQEISITKDE